jgi:sugar lactone lactonase YvrE
MRNSGGPSAVAAMGGHAMSSAPYIEASVNVAIASDALLGESPLWSPQEGALYWVDIKAPRLFRHDFAAQATRITAMPEPVGAIALRRGGGLVAALRSGLALIDSDGAALPPFSCPEADLPGNRFNDGKCDRAGRFWAASMHDGEVEPSGSLYRAEGLTRCQRMETGFVIGNGLGWSPDNRTFYFTDSVRRRIYAYDFDLDSGSISNRRVFAAVPDDSGFPDGLCVDAEGHVWSAHWDGWRVTRYAPDGRIVAVVRMPVPRPTSCAFGGEDLRTLYVTSARIGLDAAALAASPSSGAVLALRPGATGLAEPSFRAA